MIRKKTVSTVLAILVALGFSASAFFSVYPTKPVQMLIPSGAGGSSDSMGRILAKASEKHLGQNIVAVNRPGAGGGIMYTALKEAKADGYTIGWNQWVSIPPQT